MTTTPERFPRFGTTLSKEKPEFVLRDHDTLSSHVCSKCHHLMVSPQQTGEAVIFHGTHTVCSKGISVSGDINMIMNQVPKSPLISMRAACPFDSFAPLNGTKQVSHRLIVIDSEETLN